MLDEARAGAAEGLVVVADHQTAGRGRLGRTWVAPPGSSLLVSVLFRPRALEAGHLLTTAVALAACDACERVAGVAPDLKWPNDLLVDDRKLGGILAEAEGVLVVVGLGLNVNWTSGAPEGAVALNPLAGRDVDRAALLDELLLSLDVRHGAPDLMDAYRARCSTIGRRLRVELAGGDLAGTAVEIDDDGALVVDVDGERRRVLAGDVVHVRPA